VVSRRVGSGKPGYPLQENITMPTPDGGMAAVAVQVSELTKRELPAELFDVPLGYRQVNSLAELNGVPQVPQQAMSQLAGFNGQIKSKDDVTVQYQLVPAGQTSPRLQNSLDAKAKSNGEDVLAPLLQQAATAVLTEVSKK
jgi:hypothetical protein